MDTTLQNLQRLFAEQGDAAKALTGAYSILLGGAPSQQGYVSLINAAISTNYGAGPGPVFNQENIFINSFNSLVQGNGAAKTAFLALLGGKTTLSEQIAALYAAFVPASEQTAEGLAFFTRPEGLKFYQDVASERGVVGDTGGAIIALSSLVNILTNSGQGIGAQINTFTQRVTDGSTALPEASTDFTPLASLTGSSIFQIVSLGTDGQAINADAYRGASDDSGRYVLFETRATNVTGNGENFRPDYFVRDTVTGATTQVSATSSGLQSNGTPSGADVSGNGKLVVFSSNSDDLTADDTNKSGDVFLFNLDGKSLTRISPDMIGTQEVRFATNAGISGDGRYVIYEAGTATRTELGVTDITTTSSIILHDTVTKTTEFITQPRTRNPEFADSRSDSPQISEDGRYVMFTSTAGHIHAEAGETVTDRYVKSDAIFLHDRSSNSTELIFKYNTEFDVLNRGKYGYPHNPIMSGDGSKIVLSRYVGEVGFDKPKWTTELILFDVNTKTETIIDSGRELTSRTVANAFAFDISDDGRYVAFTSSYNPDGTDVRHNFDWLYVYDVQSGQTRLVTSQEVDGTVSSLLVFHPFISGDGSKLGFSTGAEFLANDTNSEADVFLTSNPFLFQTQNGNRLYTSSETEREDVIDTLGHLEYEGIAHYIDVA